VLPSDWPALGGGLIQIGCSARFAHPGGGQPSFTRMYRDERPARSYS